MYEKSKNDWLISAAPRSARSSQGSPAVWFPHHDELTHGKWPCPKHHHPQRKPGGFVQWQNGLCIWETKKKILERGDLCFFSAISSTTRHVSMVCTCVHKKIMKQLLFQPDIKCSDKRSTSSDKMTPQIATIVTTWCFPIIHHYGVYGRIHTHIEYHISKVWESQMLNAWYIYLHLPPKWPINGGSFRPYIEHLGM